MYTFGYEGLEKYYCQQTFSLFKITFLYTYILLLLIILTISGSCWAITLSEEYVTTTK